MKNQIRPPFTPDMAFKVRRPFTLSGQQLGYDDPVDTTGIEERRLKQMYEARLIDADDRTPDEIEAHMKAKPAEKPAGEPKAAKAGGKPTATGTAQAASPASAGKAKMEHTGFGKWKVLRADGSEAAAGLTKKDAQAELAKHQ